MANLRTRSGSTPQPTSTTGRRAQRGATQNADNKPGSSSHQTSTGKTRGRPKKINVAVPDHSTTDPALLDEDAANRAALAPVVEEVNRSRLAELPPVQESEGEGHEHYAPAVAAQQLDGLPSPGNQSAVSATTAITAFSQHAIRDLQSRKEELLEILPEFCGKANDMLRIMAPIADPTEGAIEVVLQDLWAEGSKKMAKLTNKLRPEFEEDYRQFAQDGLHFISRDLLLRSLLGVDSFDMLSAGPGRPDDLIYKANLAELMYTLLVGLPEDDRLMFLCQLDEQFPLPFLARLGADAVTPGGSFLVQMCFETSMAIKVQILIARVLSQEDLDHDAIIGEVFGMDTADPTGGTVRKWNSDFFLEADSDLPGDYEKFVKAQVQALRPFTMGDSSIVKLELDRLVDAHPWRHFLRKVGAWAAARNSELEQNIAMKGGPDVIVTNLRLGNYRRPKSMAGAGILALKQAKQRRKSQKKTADVADGTASLEQLASAANEKQSWFDPQANATTLTFDDTQVTNPNPAPDVSQDLGFGGNGAQDLQRVAGEGQIALGKRPMAIMQQPDGNVEPSPRPAKQRRIRKAKIVAVPAGDTDAANQFAQGDKADGHVAGPDEDHGEEDGRERLVGTPPPSIHSQTGQRAREFTHKQKRAGQAPQKRNAWSDSETNALLWYVERYGSKWAEIMNADNGLHFSKRSQVALKDKARNIIRNAYKVGEPIPKGLEDYNLPENMKQELRDLGIDIN